MNIIYEDNEIIAVHKEAGIASQTSKIGQKDLVSTVVNHLNGGYAAIINRLDQPVEGIVLFAKNRKTAADLSLQLKEGNIKKFYYADYFGKAEIKEGCMVDYLIHDKKNNISKIVDPNNKEAKKAVLEFSVIEENENNTGRMKIHLITGRHHQIRVQMAGSNLPLLGDRKYAPKKAQEMSEKLGIKNVALKAFRLEFNHPMTGKEIILEII